MKEVELYPPVKHFFEQCGYEIKSEVGSCDVVAIKDDALIIIELKTSLNLQVLLQGVDRYNLTNTIYIAIPHEINIVHQKRKQVIKLMRLMGLGLMTVDPYANVGQIDVLCEPGPYRARINSKRQTRIFTEFKNRQGDPNAGGHAMQDGAIITAYRQKAEAIAHELAQNGALTTRILRERLSEPKVTQILSNNYYGWFERVERGCYQLSEYGSSQFKLLKD